MDNNELKDITLRIIIAAIVVGIAGYALQGWETAGLAMLGFFIGVALTLFVKLRQAGLI